MADRDDIEALRRENAALRAELTATQAILAEKDAQLQRILNTLGWRLLSKYGRFKYGVLVPALEKLRRRAPGELPAIAGAPVASFARAAREITYAEWAAATEAVRSDPVRASRRVAQLGSRPTISVITPVYDTPADVLEAAIRSVRGQFYPDWELCLYDDASPSPVVRTILERHAAEDPRIRVAFGAGNRGISGAANGALALATGGYVAFLDHDDALTPDALLEMAAAIADTGADVLYSDEDKYDARGRRHDPFFKPDWSPDLFLSIMYTCHLTVMRRDLVERIGGFREGFEGSQDYDLWLRATEVAEKIHHVPMVLYHWRQVAGSTAVDVGNKGYAHERSKRAIAEALSRRGIAGTVGDGPVPTSFHVVRHVVDEPKVSVLIPTRDRVDLLAQAIEGIEKKTDYRNVEIVIVDNGSVEKETLDYLAASPHRVIRDDLPFNFSRLNNVAARAATGELLLLLNNDTEPIAPGWMRAMVEHATRTEVGAVGAKLLFQSGKVQHAGVVLGIGGVAGHSHKYFAGDAAGSFQALNMLRNYSAVTAACLMLRKSVFDEVGGFDEEHLAVAFNDVDFCLRIRERGYLIVWTPYALVTHYESESRGYDLNPAEIDYMIARWGDVLLRDPYYSPNLTLVHEDFSVDVTKPDGVRAVAGQRAAEGLEVEVGGAGLEAGGGAGLEAGGGAGLEAGRGAGLEAGGGAGLEAGSETNPGDAVAGGGTGRGERRPAASFRSAYDRLAGFAFEVADASLGWARSRAGDARLRVTVRACEAVGSDPGDVVCVADAALASTTPSGDLFVLFDAPLGASKAAFHLELSIEEAVPAAADTVPLRLRAAAQASPAFRLLYA